MEAQEIFENIFKTNLWGDAESVSGHGSRLENTKNLRITLAYLMQTLEIKSILDIPCGDWNWMNMVDLSKVSYEGWDIVNELILENQQKYEKANIRFLTCDALKTALPRTDLIIARDLIIHFPTKAIWSFLENVVRSCSRYILKGRYLSEYVNQEIEFGGFRPVNLEAAPFFLHSPLLSIPEEEHQKYMVLYKVDDLSAYVKCNRERT